MVREIQKYKDVVIIKKNTRTKNSVTTHNSMGFTPSAQYFSKQISRSPLQIICRGGERCILPNSTQEVMNQSFRDREAKLSFLQNSLGQK